MRFAICNELFADWSIDETLGYVAALGYAGLELAPYTLAPVATALSRQQRLAVRASARAHGVALVGLHWLLAAPPGLHLTHPDAGVRAHTIRHMEGLIELAADLEAPLLVLGSPRQRSALPPYTPAQATEILGDGLRRLAGRAERAGVTLCLEPLPAAETDVVTTLEEAIAVVEAVGSAAVRLILDVKSMCAEGKPLADLITRGAPYTAHVHANDANRGGPGSGAVDFGPILAQLAAVGYDGWVSVEVFDMASGAQAIARQSLEYLRSCLPTSLVAPVSPAVGRQR